jgi:ribosomal protein L37AE/L43A
MAGTTYFVQECPTCGRRLQVRVNYLGKRIACRHCGAHFAACDPQSLEISSANSGSDLMTRVEQLLEASAITSTVPTSGS